MSVIFGPDGVGDEMDDRGGVEGVVDDGLVWWGGERQADLCAGTV